MDEKIVNNERLAGLFHRAARLLMRRGHHHGPVHHSQGRILSLLADQETISQRELLDILQIRSASLSELLGKLEQYGYIERSRDEQDKRGFVIAITEQGRELVQEHAKWKAEQGQSLFDLLTAEERQQLDGILTKILSSWEGEFTGGPGYCPRTCQGGNRFFENRGRNADGEPMRRRRT